MQRNLSYVDGDVVRHNPDAIAASIIELICEDLKFKDMQNNPEYMMLNSKLKDNKKQLKKNMNTNKRVRNSKKTKEPRGKSKFASKYQERIQSIKESDEITAKRKQAKIKENQRRERIKTEEK